MATVGIYIFFFFFRFKFSSDIYIELFQLTEIIWTVLVLVNNNNTFGKSVIGKQI